MSNDEVDYLSRPYCHATLDDHRRLKVSLTRYGNPFPDAVTRFLGASDTDLVIEESNHPIYDLPHVHHGIAACFPKWTVVFEGGPKYSRSDLWSPSRRRVEVSPHVFREYIERGTRFYELPDGTRRVLGFVDGESDGARTVEFSVITTSKDQRSLARDLSLLHEWMRANHYLKGQVIRADGTLLSDLGRRTWDDVALEPETRQTILDNVVRVLELGDTFRRNRVPLKRGLLLHGPPGNGKTLIGKVLAGLGKCTFVWVTAGDADSPETLRATFDMARRLRPTLLFLEDLDFYASDRHGCVNHRVLGELLSLMDGLEENDGLIVIATTNDVEAIEPALKERPSRFDVVLEIGPPAESARLQILEHYLGSRLDDVDIIGDAVKLTEGLSGAQLQEVAYLTIQRAILRGAVDIDGRARPNAQDVRAAVDKLRGTQKGRLGFTKQSEPAFGRMDLGCAARDRASIPLRGEANT